MKFLPVNNLLPSDEQLMRNIRSGDYVSYHTLFSRYYNLVCQYIYAILKNRQDTEDVAQELFLGLWAGRKRIDIRGSVAAYLFRASRNLALNKIRSNANYKSAVQRADFTDYYDADLILAGEFQERLHECIDMLPSRTKEIFLLQKAEGLKQKDIAEGLGLSLQSVKRHVWIALQKLKECLEEKGVL